MYSFGQKILDIVRNEYSINLEELDKWLSYPPKKELGDYAFSCFGISKEKKMNPNEISTRLVELLNNEDELFYDVSSMGGYVNFKVKNVVFQNKLKEILNKNIKQNNETIIIDYIGANAGKPLHIGHLCTPSQGQAIINIYKHLGYNVISDSHFGDWGGIFGAIIYAWKNNNKDNEKGLSEKGEYYLVELYQWFHSLKENKNSQAHEEIAREEFRKLSLGDKENVLLWQKFTSISIKGINKQLKELKIDPQYNIGESFYEGLNLPRPTEEDYPDLKYSMKDVVKELEGNVATKNEDGSVGVEFPEETKMPSCVLQKKDGTGLYLTSDLAAIKYRLLNWNPSKIVYFVDVRQQLHLRQAFWIAHKAWDKNGLDKTELIHAYNGFIKLKEGAMSTRKGTVIFLDKLLDEGYKRTKDILKSKGKDWKEDNSNLKAIAIGAIKYSYLSQDREKDVVFDWDKALNFEGNSGPYIQYAYVRAKKVTSQLKEIGEYSNADFGSFDKSIIKKLSEFESKVIDTAEKYKPHILAQYLYDLAQEFNSFYVNTPKILEEENLDTKNMRLDIVRKTADILKKGFELLAIDMPDEM